MSTRPPCAPERPVRRGPVLEFDAHGQPRSPLYDDIYKSRAGAAEEARAVFVEGCRLAERWSGRAAFTLLELGFGLGVNFLTTLAAWRVQPSAPRKLHYVSIEAHPVPAAQLARALDLLGVRGQDAQRLVACWPIPTPGLHRLAFADGAVTLTLAIGDAQDLAGRLELAADAIYLDGFAPSKNPRMWSAALCKSLARLARPGATLATYSCAASVRTALADAGFEVRLVPGHAGKRERIDARYAPRWRTYPPPPPPPVWAERSAMVIGAGLAGCAAASALAARGWRVTMLERRGRIASEGSGQPLVADHLHVSADDNRLARLTRAALLARSRSAAGAWPGEGPQGERFGGVGPADGLPDPAGYRALGKLQLARTPAEEAQQRRAVAALGFPDAFVQVLDPAQASDVAGVRLARGGLWLPMCGMADPAAVCAQAIADGGERIALRHRCVVARLERRDGLWHALDACGRTLACAPVVVLANAGDAARLAGADGLPMRSVRGQTTLLAPDLLAGLRCVIGGDAYACPAGGGEVLVGSTFDEGEDLEPRREADASNLARLARMLAPGSFSPQSALDGARSAAAGLRYATPDRLPLVGAVADEPALRARAAELSRNDRLPLPRNEGLFAAAGLGSRGLLWAGLAAEILACAVEGEPAPVEADLLAAVDPARFLRRRLRTRRLR